MILSCLMLLLCLSLLQPASFAVEWSFLFKNFCFFLFQGVVGVFGSDGDSAFQRFSFFLSSCILTGNVHPWVLRMCSLLFEGSEIPLSFFFFLFNTMYD